MARSGVGNAARTWGRRERRRGRVVHRDGGDLGPLDVHLADGRKLAAANGQMASLRSATLKLWVDGDNALRSLKGNLIPIKDPTLPMSLGHEVM